MVLVAAVEGTLKVEATRQLYNNIQLKITRPCGSVSFVWVVLCDCEDGYSLETDTCYPRMPLDLLEDCARAWVENSNALYEAGYGREAS